MMATSVERRDAFFREIVLKPLAGSNPEDIVIENPYWGDVAAKFPWGHGGLPEVEYERFGSEAGLKTEEVLPATALAALQALDDAQAPAAVLPWLAQRSFPAAVDLLFITAKLGIHDGQADPAWLTSAR